MKNKKDRYRKKIYFFYNDKIDISMGFPCYRPIFIPNYTTDRSPIIHKYIVGKVDKKYYDSLTDKQRMSIVDKLESLAQVDSMVLLLVLINDKHLYDIRPFILNSRPDYREIILSLRYFKEWFLMNHTRITHMKKWDLYEI